MHCLSQSLTGLVIVLIALGADAAEKSAAVKRALPRSQEDRLWERIAHDEPFETLSLRSVASALRACAQSGKHAERWPRLCDLLARAQDRDPSSKTFGNFKWTWRDAGVTDQNAVEFIMQDLTVVWLDHGQRIPPAAKPALRQLLELAVEGCLRHRVPPSYTNIAILNAANLVVLGEILQRGEVVSQGCRRLEGFYFWTWSFGAHEYCSPTYYGVNLEGLDYIVRYARDATAKSQAAALRELFWTDVAANWFGPARKLAGAHSRTYDYLRGLGPLDRPLLQHGFLVADSGSRPAVGRVPVQAIYPRPAELTALADRFPRLVRQSWGMKASQSRTHFLCRDITLSTSGATYPGASQDATMTVDLPGDRHLPRCYFIPDGREDPYGQNRYETSSARHLKALHLMPFWAAAQLKNEAVGLVVYRPEDLAAKEVVNVQSHFVLRSAPDELWLGGQRRTLPPGRPESASKLDVSAGEPLVLRYGTAAVGVRVPWARRQDGTPATITLIDDGNRHGVFRLTVEHRAEKKTVEAAAFFWVRVGSELATPGQFTAWREGWQQARPARLEAEGEVLHFAAGQASNPIVVEASAPFGQIGTVSLRPAPYRGVLECDGQELGRPLLAKDLPRRVKADTALRRLPSGGSVDLEAEEALVLPGMVLAEDPDASRGRYVVQPIGDKGNWGSAVWTVDVEKAGRYYFWARAWTKDAESDSFFITVVADGAAQGRTAWHLGVGSRWSWRGLADQKSRQLVPLVLPAGVCRIQLTPREAGARIDRLMISAKAETQLPKPSGLR